MSICEQCGKEHDGSFGSGRFCCRSCSNKWVSLHQSKEAKARKVEKGKKNLIHDGSIGFCAKGYWTEDIKAAHRYKMNSTEVTSKLSKSLIKFYKDNPDYPTESVRKKISEGIKRSIEKGKRPGYLSLERSESFPEKYWSEILDNLGISYIREFKIIKKDLDIEGRGCYFLDFLLPDNVDLEIGGSQHYGFDQHNHDIIRDNNLERAGYSVYRIRWRNPKIHQDIISNDVREFIKWYSNKICASSSMVESLPSKQDVASSSLV